MKTAITPPPSEHSGDPKEDPKAARLRELELAVRSGTYRPDPALIAARMLASPDFRRALEAAPG